ncbi:MAG: hypothetical protein AAB373_01840 [Patescibacteria group bacterium]
MRKIFVFLLALLILTTNLQALAVTTETTVLTKEELNKTIKDGITWLLNAQESDGHFRYEYSPFWDRYTDDDNIVRQAGAFYIIGEAARKDTQKLYALQPALEKAAAYLDSKSINGSFNSKSFRCVYKSEKVCTLGGTSLALLGLLDLVEAYPKTASKYQKSIENYKNYLLAMKKSDEGFRDAFYLDREQKTNESSFSNGEAFLALVRYYKYKPDTELKTLIEESFDYFDETYRKDWDSNFYLWGMAALKDWYQIFPKEEHYNFTKEYTDWRISEQEVNKTSPHNRCAYIEGVTSAYSILADDKDQKKYLEEINFWLTKSRTLQLSKSNFIRISFSDGELKILRAKETSRSLGGFLTSPSEPFQRIDFTQHCVSSYLQKLTDIDKQTL